MTNYEPSRKTRGSAGRRSERRPEQRPDWYSGRRTDGRLTRQESRTRRDDRTRYDRTRDARERSARRTQRALRDSRSRSVGATSLSASAANALGISRRNASHPYGRGETARRVEREHTDTIRARPAVYTGEARGKGLLSRVPLKGVSLPAFRLPSLQVPHIPVAAVLGIAVVLLLAMIFGPARTYYAAWRDAGVLQAKYDALVTQKDELTDQVERLQTLEGIEDEARRRGYVYPEEEALVVSDWEEQQVADPSLVDEAVAEYEQSLPWYVNALDTLFGYHHE